MISDVLFAAVKHIDGYLSNPTFDTMYSGSLRERIVAVRNEMNTIRYELDAPPDLLAKSKSSFNIQKLVENLDYSVAPEYPDDEEYKIDKIVEKFSGFIVAIMQAPVEQRIKLATQTMEELDKLGAVLLPIKNHIEKMRAGDKSKLPKNIFQDLIRLDLKMREVTGVIYMTASVLRTYVEEVKKQKGAGA